MSQSGMHTIIGIMRDVDTALRVYALYILFPFHAQPCTPILSVHCAAMPAVPSLTRPEPLRGSGYPQSSKYAFMR